jgi:hypothetical protein
VRRSGVQPPTDQIIVKWRDGAATVGTRVQKLGSSSRMRLQRKQQLAADTDVLQLEHALATEEMRALLERLAAEDADLVIPRSARGYEPLCAVYGKACAPGIRHRIEHGELQASVLPRGLRIAELGPEALAACDPDGLLFVNVNTPHDYARANDSRNRITND